MKFSRPVGVLCVLALLIFVAGCGGGSSSSSSVEASGSTQAAYIEEADAICQGFKEKVEPLNAELQELGESEGLETPRGEVRLAEGLDAGVTLGQEEGKEIEALEPPGEGASTIGRWIAVGEEGLTKIGEAVEALEAGEGPRYTELAEEGEALVDQAHGIAQGYGFKVCGSEE